MNGCANGSSRAALRIYHGQLPDRRMSYNRIFQQCAHFLNATFRTRWIGRSGLVPWPPRSPDLSSLDCFLWGHLKNLVPATALDSYEDLVARISEAAADIRMREICT
ncbi:uncharacterized protein TNCV_2917801 [Trichonephila clavipes]|nr:uncharacterized protein TNCV_2917801 [Trichonephila clavipes]